MATKYIRRLSTALHIVLFIRYLQTLPTERKEAMKTRILQNSLDENDHVEFEKFLLDGRLRNGTFSLHYDMMSHCDICNSLCRETGRRDWIHTLLFSTPVEGSKVNLALDTQREMGHKHALKAFRSRSTMPSIVPRMSLLDTMNEKGHTTKTVQKTQAELLGVKSSDTDIRYVKRIVSLILRQGGISLTEDTNVYIVYDARKVVLPDSILDMKTEEIGAYLIKRHLASYGLFGCSKSDKPHIESVHGPKELLQKVKASKGVTIKRTAIKRPDTNKTLREKKEENRVKDITREMKKNDCLSSFESKDLIHLNKKAFPKDLTQSASVATIEFAGVKFKTSSTSGTQYLKYVENAVLMKTKISFPKIRNIVVCEEKYKFTPDVFKSATREQRQTKPDFSITHLKTGEDILSTHKFAKKTITTSAEGKQLINAVVLHMFAVSSHWPRDEEQLFTKKVYVVLKKPGNVYHIYNITEILSFIEMTKLALVLSM
ncbi:LOW QUALITY PROTEIN: hypothetical protein MAR_013702, partial [Mya arenaria]